MLVSQVAQNHSRRSLVFGALLFAVPGTALAQQAALPAAAELVARHVAAIGGEQAIRNHQGYRVIGSIEIPAAGMKGDLEIVASAPNRQSLKIMLPGIGEVLSGFDGTNAWSVSAMQGARLLEGKELEDVIMEADFYGGQLRSHSGITERRTIEQTEMNGESCYRVQVTWKSGRQSWECYSAASGLLIASGGKRETPQGTIEVVNLVGDYKEFDGVKYATISRQQLMGMEQIFRIATLEFGAIEESAFAPPPQIETLIKAKKGS